MIIYINISLEQSQRESLLNVCLFAAHAPKRSELEQNYSDFAQTGTNCTVT